MTAVKCTLGYVQMVKLLFGQCVFIAKSANKTAYCDCNTVQTAVQCLYIFTSTKH